MWTSHGHQIIGTIAEDPVLGGRPDRVARCGGPEMCNTCGSESRSVQKQAGLDEHGQPIPFEGNLSITQMLARVRSALILTRPMSEVGPICDKLAMIIAEHKVLMDGATLATNTPRPPPNVLEGEGWSTEEPTDAGFYYNGRARQTLMYLRDSLGQWYAISDSAMFAKCEWGYIAQTLGVFPLRRLNENTDG